MTHLSPSPAHDRCESVVVSLYSGGSDGLVHHPSSEQMCFVQDLALDMAQFLLGTVGEVKGTEGALLLNECQIPLQECEKLDQSLALAIKHLRLPPDWSLLGDSNGKHHFIYNMRIQFIFGKPFTLISSYKTFCTYLKPKCHIQKLKIPGKSVEWDLNYVVLTNKLSK